MNTLRIIALGAALAFAVTAVALGLHWTVNRVYVEEGHSLVLRYKGPLFSGSRKEAKPGHFAEEGEIGVLREMRGPGRHFYCPIWWQRDIEKDKVVQPGEVAIVTSKLGENLPEGEFLVDGNLGQTKHRGILRKVIGPGRYRVNPYEYDFNVIKANVETSGNQKKYSGWVEVPTGYVGVVTLKASNPALGVKKGIQDKVLPPGLYPVNPREQEIDLVEVGFWETSIDVAKQKDPSGKDMHDESGEPIAAPGSGIAFPSNDGFHIQIDFTAIWGIMPDQAPKVISTFGNLQAVEQKVILPQCESICRNNGSEVGAVELLVGESRQEFQVNTSEDVAKVLKEKDLTLLYGLVRHIYIPQEVRVPKQQGYIADELKLTREQETATARTEADLREAEKKVDLEAATTAAETEKLVANLMAEGEKKVREVEAETKRQVAAIDKEIAEFDAQKRVVLGEATATSQRMKQEAESQKFQLAVDAFGSGEAYNKWQFAEGLPEQIELNMLYAGEGTLWTDLDRVMPTIPVGPQRVAPATGNARRAAAAKP